MKIRYLFIHLLLIPTLLVTLTHASDSDVNYDGCSKKGSKCSCFNAGKTGICAYGAYKSDIGQNAHGYYCSCRTTKLKK